MYVFFYSPTNLGVALGIPLSNSNHGTDTLLDDGVELVIWDITEAAVSMVAACIPVLRVLIRDSAGARRRFPTLTWTNWRSTRATGDSHTGRGEKTYDDDTDSERSVSMVGDDLGGRGGAGRLRYGDTMKL